MFIVLLDEPGVFLFKSPADASREIEPIDAETGIRAAFDESAVPYAVDWLRPNRRRKRLFGLLESVEPGEYRFLPAGAPQPAALIDLIESHQDDTTPVEAKAALASLLARLRTR